MNENQVLFRHFARSLPGCNVGERRVLIQESRFKDMPEWHVTVNDETYSVRAADSEDAAFIVAEHLGFPCRNEDDWHRMMRGRDKSGYTMLQLDDGRGLVADLAIDRNEA